MSHNVLIESLRANAKDGDLFNCDGTIVSYKTGFATLDYNLGYLVNVFDDDNKLKTTYPSLGITAGTFTTIIGKSHVGKSTLAIQIASNIVRPFPNGSVIHYDLEVSSNYTRIGILSKFTPSEMKAGKYILRQQKFSIEEIKKSISKIYQEKMSKDIYLYDTGKVNEFGEPIKICEPTAVIIDSVASLMPFVNENTKDGVATMESITSQTEVMRVTAEVGRLLKELMPMMRSANICVFLINHIKSKPPMGTPQAAELMYLKQDETMPCGKALQYYTHNMLRLTAVGAEKYTPEEFGFDGFGVKAQMVKSRTNANGKEIPMVFDKVKGYDALRTLWKFSKDNDMLGGNKNGYYYTDNKDVKFHFDTIHEEFSANRELYKHVYSHVIPVLETTLSSIKPEEMEVIAEEMDY